MKNNLILRSLTQLKSRPVPELTELFALVNFDLSPYDMPAYLKDEDEEGYLPCPDVVLNHLLEALRIHFRGLREGEMLPLEIPAEAQDNNTILKKIRIALNLQAQDLDDIFETAGLGCSRHEVSALFRKPGHKHYKVCTDEMLVAVLQGLSIWGSRV